MQFLHCGVIIENHVTKELLPLNDNGRHVTRSHADMTNLRSRGLAKKVCAYASVNVPLTQDARSIVIGEVLGKNK